MKYQAFRHILLIVLFFIICPSPSKAGENIELETYLLVVTLGKEWKPTINREAQKVTFDNFEKDSGHYRTILVQEVDASKIYNRLHSERWVADAYRRGEESDMIVRGVMKGMYELKDLKKFELKVDVKHLYGMTYTQIFKKIHGYGFLYLYFPDFKESNKFYVFLYSYLYPGSESRDVSLEEFHSVVKGFKLKRDF